jgi:membrane protein implicated in regulation of membrane protease activity
VTFLGVFSALVGSSEVAAASAGLVSPAAAWALVLGVLALSCGALWVLNRETARVENRPAETDESMRPAA